MKALAWIPILGLCVAVSPGCRARSGVPVSHDAPNYSNVVALADHVVSKTGHHWGSALEVRWQPTPLNRYAVIYAAPKSDFDGGGYREVHVYTNSEGGLTARE